MSNDYNSSNVHLLSQREAVRLRPAMYISDIRAFGLSQLIIEIVDNSIDEHNMGFGNVVNVHIFKDYSVEVEDFGRGIPVGYNDEFKDKNGNPLNTLTGILTSLNSGGKFETSDSKYSSVVGMHGMGAAVTNFLSEYFDVEVSRDGVIYHQRFQRGEPCIDLETIGKSSQTGTKIKYKPDKKVFKYGLDPGERITKRLKESAFLNKGLVINYINELTNINTTYCFEDGIAGYVKEFLGNKTTLYDEPFFISGSYNDEENGIIKCDMAFITDDESERNTVIKTFANTARTYDGGTHLNAFKNVYKDCLNEYGLDKKIIKEPIEQQYYMDGLYAVISIKIHHAQLEGQTKSKLGNKEAGDAVISIFKDEFKKIIKNKDYKKIIESIINRANNTKIAELAARTARLNARKTKKLSNMALPAKLADCQIHDGFSETYVCEGDSAGNSIKLTRNKVFQACLPLRGKILNVNKAELSKILSAESVKGIIASLGTGIGKNFDISKLRYNKIIIATDADID